MQKQRKEEERDLIAAEKATNPMRHDPMVNHLENFRSFASSISIASASFSSPSVSMVPRYSVGTAERESGSVDHRPRLIGVRGRGEEELM